MTSEEVKDQIFKSYIRIRKGLAVLAFLFPFGLLVIGLWYGIPPRDSMSAYYFAQIPGENTQYVFPMRAWFVGILWAIGVFLYLYKGFSVTENRFLNIAGLAAICVALFPMHVPEECTSCGSSAWAWAHLTAAGILFLCMSIVAWACTDETLATLPDAVREKYRRRYTSLAVAMTIAPVAVYSVIWTIWIGRKTHPGLFWAEMTGVVIFALYWGLKSYELDTLKTQQMKLSGTGLPGSIAARREKPTGEDIAASKTFRDKFNKTADAARHWTGGMLEFNKLPGTAITRRHFAEGQVLFSEGDPSGSVFRVLSGAVEILREIDGKPILLGTVGAGQFIGEMGVVENRSRSATVRAASEVEAETLTPTEFFDQIAGSPQAARELIQRLSQRLREADDRIVKDQRRSGRPHGTPTDADSQTALVPANNLYLAAKDPWLQRQFHAKLALTDLPFVVGRGPVTREGGPPMHPDLKLDDTVPFRLSRNHFMILKRDGSYYVHDLRSTLGTIVNGQPIGEHFRIDDAPLRAGENEVIAGGVDSRFVFSVFIA